MGSERFFAWCLLAFWSTWLFAIQGYLASKSGPGPWVPDVGIMLLLVLDRRCSPASMLLAILIVSSARIGCSADPPLAILAGYGILMGCLRLLRRVVELDQFFLRALAAAIACLVLNKYWALTRAIALASADSEQSVSSPWSSELPPGSLSMALATGIAILVLGSALLHLPGLSPLRRGDY